MSEEKTITSRSTVPEDLNRKVIGLAAMQGITKNEFLVQALREKVERDLKKQ